MPRSFPINSGTPSRRGHRHRDSHHCGTASPHDPSLCEVRHARSRPASFPNLTHPTVVIGFRGSDFSCGVVSAYKNATHPYLHRPVVHISCASSRACMWCDTKRSRHPCVRPDRANMLLTCVCAGVAYCEFDSVCVREPSAIT